MADIEKVMSWLEGLTEPDWREYYSDSEVSNIAKAVLELLKEQQNSFETVSTIYKIAHEFMMNNAC